MQAITLRNVSRAMGLQNVLHDVNLSLSEGERVVLVGENGSGKTTLMRIMSGTLHPTSGIVSVDSWCQRLFVPQEFDTDEHISATSYLADTHPSAVAALLGRIDASNVLDCDDVQCLSGGQQRLLQLAVAFAQRPDFLLIDEPENHLDYYAREWLIERLRGNPGGTLLVSHDQYVIDEVANKIVELWEGETATYPGSYDLYLEMKARQVGGDQRQWEQEDREIKRHREMVVRLRQQARQTPKFSGMFHSKERKLAKMEAAHGERPKIEGRRVELHTAPVDRRGGKRIWVGENLTLARRGSTLFSDTNLTLIFGDKVCLFGPNGCGKSSLLKVMLQELPPTSGTSRLGNDMTVGYFSQEHFEELDYNQTAMEELQRHVGKSDGVVRSILSNFLFDRFAAEQRIRTLSGGQKTRLRFAKLLSRTPDLLILDEPTNHLDRQTWEVLSQALQAYTGTLLIVSHDRTFVDEVATSLWVFEETDIRRYSGTLSEYLSG